MPERSQRPQQVARALLEDGVALAPWELRLVRSVAEAQDSAVVSDRDARAVVRIRERGSKARRTRKAPRR